jgi:hypothetical protein
MPFTQEQRWDHARDLIKHDSSPRHQKRAVSKLVGYCWGLTHGGILSLDIEKQLRDRIREVCIEFNMEPPAEPRP